MFGWMCDLKRKSLKRQERHVTVFEFTLSSVHCFCGLVVGQLMEYKKCLDGVIDLLFHNHVDDHELDVVDDHITS